MKKLLLVLGLFVGSIIVSGCQQTVKTPSEATQMEDQLGGDSKRLPDDTASDLDDQATVEKQLPGQLDQVLKTTDDTLEKLDAMPDDTAVKQSDIE